MAVGFNVSVGRVVAVDVGVLDGSAVAEGLGAMVAVSNGVSVGKDF